MRKDRSRKEVLWYVCQFSLGVEIGGEPYAGLRDSRFRPNKSPALGSLVAIQSMRDPDWYLSWVLGVTVGANEFATVYTLESLETGAVIDWSNIGVYEYDPRCTNSHPEWRWTDEQWAFRDRWNRLCYKKRDAYIVLPLMPVFEGDTVELGTRIRFGLGDPPKSRRFEKWSKLRDKDLLAFFDESVAEFDARPRRNNPPAAETPAI